MFRASLLLIYAVFAFSDGAQAEALDRAEVLRSRNNQEVLQKLERLWLAQSTGACGGGVSDIEIGWICCSMDQRPECDSSGNCSCNFDQYCYDTCAAAGNCDETPAC